TPSRIRITGQTGRLQIWLGQYIKPPICRSDPYNTHRRTSPSPVCDCGVWNGSMAAKSQIWGCCLAFVLAMTLACRARAQVAPATSFSGDLTKMSLEDLMNVE